MKIIALCLSLFYTLNIYAAETAATSTASTAVSTTNNSGTSTAAAGQYGAPLTLKDSVTVDTALEQFQKDPKKTFLIEAKVDKVCQKKGCWMTLKSKNSDVRITFKDYSFFVPITLVGKTVLVEGNLNAKKLTLAQTKHYVEDEGGDPSKVTEPMTEYQMTASGVSTKL